MLQSAAGQRTVWSVAGYQSQGWRSGVVPVQSSSEFQVSGVAWGAGYTPGVWGALPASLCITPHIPSSPADRLRDHCAEVADGGDSGTG